MPANRLSRLANQHHFMTNSILKIAEVNIAEEAPTTSYAQTKIDY